MRLNQFTVAQKLWSLVGCLLVGLLLVTAGSLLYLNGVSATIAQQVQRAQAAASGSSGAGTVQVTPSSAAPGSGGAGRVT